MPIAIPDTWKKIMPSFLKSFEAAAIVTAPSLPASPRAPRPTEPFYLFERGHAGEMQVETTGFMTRPLKTVLAIAAQNGFNHVRFEDGVAKSNDAAFPMTDQELQHELEMQSVMADYDQFPERPGTEMILSREDDHWVYAPLKHMARGPVIPAVLKL